MNFLISFLFYFIFLFYSRLSPGPPPKSDTPTEISNSPSTSVEVSSIAFHITGDNNKMYCIRNIQQQPHSLNSSILDCAVSFTVDRNICVVGIQVILRLFYSFLTY